MMFFKPVILWTDLLFFILVITAILLIFWMRRHEDWRAPWRQVGHRKLSMIAAVILLSYFVVALLDSVHFRVLKSESNHNQYYSSQSIVSLLDIVISPLGFQDEKTYSAPFSLVSYSKILVHEDDSSSAIYPRLIYGGAHLSASMSEGFDIFKKFLLSFMEATLVWIVGVGIVTWYLSRKNKLEFSLMLTQLLKGKTFIAWREILLTLWVILLVIFFIRETATSYHIFGTDKIGKDVLYDSIKSIRTGLMIGTLTTLVMLPFAILFGTQAGYFGGWVDDLIQYIYTTLSSIPGVLLISAAVLSLQIFIANHPEFFPSLESRADARLLALCLILGITSWTTLCRLLRAETLKLREMDFVRAAVTMGVTDFRIILSHVVPNVMHIILITVVLDFSGLVLAEAVLSYVGVGVDPTTISWGNMINSARLDLAREPVVWWPLTAAFIFMFVLVLAANLFADAVRDAFDPRLRIMA